MPSSTEVSSTKQSPVKAKSKSAAGNNKRGNDINTIEHLAPFTKCIVPRRDMSLTYPDFLSTPVHRRCTSSFLRPGSKFFGSQNCSQHTYEVNVEIKDVDMERAFVCGYLRIEGLTEDHPTLITYFEGEMISEHYSFVTKREDWGTDEHTDMCHWHRFRSWRTMLPEVQNPNYVHKNYEQHDDIYMRWKECFLVPDHKVQNIHNASYDGFYYIRFNQLNGSITGYYFHRRSERYQQLELTHIPDAGVSPYFEFR